MKKPGLFDKLMSIYETHQLEAISRSWVLAPPAERKHRLRTVMGLSLELDRIKKVSIFATGLAEGAIEAVIEGDWKTAADYVSHFTFTDESEDLRKQYAPIWEPFVVLLQTACAEQTRLTEGVRPRPS